MCEVLTHALFDGSSSDTSDPAQPPPGADRDPGPITGFNESDPAVQKFMQVASDAARCQTALEHAGIDRQTSSDFFEITARQLCRRISSGSLNAGSVVSMTCAARESERKFPGI